MKYQNYNDHELISIVSENHEEVHTILFEKYKPLIIKMAQKMYRPTRGDGLEINDLIQEGFLGFTNAINNYDENKETTFYTFAKVCIERKMQSLIISTTRLKHKILNDSLSLEEDLSNCENLNLGHLLGDLKNDPEVICLDKERNKELLKTIKKRLTPFEEQVLDLKINSFTYQEIASILDKTPKAIDNAIQRIKFKAKAELKLKI